MASTTVSPTPIEDTTALTGAHSNAVAEPSVVPIDHVGQLGEDSGFGVLHPVVQSLYDPRQGLYKDGRVRNPVPSKLKGKTDARKGNFGVMHMDLIPKGELLERDAAAKRTSENTELAAKLAQKDGYVPLKRVKNVHQPGDLTTPNPAAAAAVAPVPPPTSSSSRKKPPTPSETKSEQARLLTLLRSLHPVLVVDQICKALAFFGGIPGAPPPADGSFPESAEANGPGSVFINFMAEIFPKLGHGLGEFMPHAVQETTEQAQRRGRPRGSKGTRTRKEKEHTTRSLAATRNRKLSKSNSPGGSAQTTVEDSWVDVDDTAPDIESGEGVQRAKSDMPTTVGVPGPGDEAASLSSTGVKEANMASTGPGAVPAMRRRGRPKGSKNRPKGLPDHQDEERATDGPTVDIERGRIITDAPQPKKRRPGPGRPKGSKNRPKDPAPSSSRQFHQQGTAGSENLSVVVSEPSAHGVPPTVIVKEGMPQTRYPVIPLPQLLASAHYLHPQSVTATPLNDTNTTVTKSKTGLPSVKGGALGTGGGDTAAAVLDVGEPHRSHIAKKARKLEQSHSLDDRVTDAVTAPPSKRQKTSKESRHPANTSGQAVSLNIDEDDALYVLGASRQAPRPSFSSQYKMPNKNVGETHQANNRDQSNNTAGRSHARQQPSPQHTGTRLQQSFTHGTTAGASYDSGPKSPAQSTYSAQARRPPQGFYTQSHSLQAHPTQHDQIQPITAQHQKQYHPHSTSAQLGTTIDPISSHFKTSTKNLGSADESYHRRMTPTSQPSFSAGVTSSMKPAETNFGQGTPRTAQHHTLGFPARPTSRTSTSNIQSFHGYTDANYLDMASLGSTSNQAGLGIKTPSYNMANRSAERDSATAAASPFRSSSAMDHSGFDTSIAEPAALQDRIFHTLGHR